MTDFHRLDADADARFLRAGVADPFTRVPFRPTNEVVICKSRGVVMLRETWEALGGCPDGDATVPWDADAALALASGDGSTRAATPVVAPSVSAPPAATPRRAPATTEADRGNRWLTPLLLAVGVAGIVVLGVVVVGLMNDDEDVLVVEETVEPAGPTGPSATSITEAGLTNGALSEDDFVTEAGRFQDLYTFAADSSGRVLSFTLTSSDFAPDVVVETPEGDRLSGEVISEDGDTGEIVVAVRNLRGPGLYRATVTSRRPGETGSYALRTQFETPVRPLSPNGSAVRATLGQFSEAADGFFVDRYRFSGASDREHTLTVRSSAFAPTLEVTGPGGAVRGETGRAGGVVTFVFTPSASGTHTLRVSSQSEGDRGDYSVQLAVEAEPEPEDDTPTVSGALRNGQAVSDSLAASAVKTYTFSGRVGDRVFLEARTDGFTPLLQLVGPDGARQTAQPDGDRARIRLTLPSGGTYRVNVGAGATGGEVRITLEQQAAVTSDDIPRLPGADTPRPPAQDGSGGDYTPQPIGDGTPSDRAP